MKKVEKFLSLARSLAEESSFRRFRLGSCIVKKGKIISVGFNLHKTHPLQRHYNTLLRTDIEADAPHYIHAEMAALIKAKSLNIDLKGAELYVYRIAADGEPSMARPCAACMKAIKVHGIKKVYYTTNDGIAEEKITGEPIKVAKSKSLI